MDYSCMRTHVSAQLGRTHGSAPTGKMAENQCSTPCQPLDWSQAPVFAGVTNRNYISPLRPNERPSLWPSGPRGLRQTVQTGTVSAALVSHKNVATKQHHKPVPDSILTPAFVGATRESSDDGTAWATCSDCAASEDRFGRGAVAC